MPATASAAATATARHAEPGARPNGRRIMPEHYRMSELMCRAKGHLLPPVVFHFLTRHFLSRLFTTAAGGTTCKLPDCPITAYACFYLLTNWEAWTAAPRLPDDAASAETLYWNRR
jgi:hypothetical protein